VANEVRPADDEYYETRLPLFSQGDIFRDVPLAYSMPSGEVVAADMPASGRRFPSVPFEPGLAMLVTPTCSMRSQVDPIRYAHPVRTLVPLRPLDELTRTLGLDEAKLGLLRKYDRLINYMYVPSHDDLRIPESLALLYMPSTIHHDFLEGQRIVQLAVEGARQLHRKLVWFVSGLLESRTIFDPPMD
jgi:hypothetical protein